MSVQEPGYRAPGQYGADHPRGGAYPPEPREPPEPEDPEKPEPTAVDVLVSTAQVIVLTVFLIAFLIVVTTSMAESVNGVTDLPFDFAPSFWLVVALLMFLLYFLTREWEGMRSGEVVQFDAAAEARAASEAEVY